MSRTLRTAGRPAAGAQAELQVGTGWETCNPFEAGSALPRVRRGEYRRFDVLCGMEPLMVGGSTTGEIHFGAHSDVPPPLRWLRRAAPPPP